MFHKDIVGNEACGATFSIPEKNGEGIVLYSASAVVLGVVRVLTYSNTANKEYVASAAATLTSRGVKKVVALEALAAAGLSKWQTSGLAEADCATGVAAGDYLEIINGGDELICDGTTGSTTQSDQSAAICVDANASGANAVGTVLLIDEPTEVAAS
uniref:Uncharacterized protein n=1 Tax=viral metagenome TaxID=1070528 RepID=A0A6M3L4U1_9ZZZZ